MTVTCSNFYGSALLITAISLNPHEAKPSHSQIQSHLNKEMRIEEEESVKVIFCTHLGIKMYLQITSSTRLLTSLQGEKKGGKTEKKNKKQNKKLKVRNHNTVEAITMLFFESQLVNSSSERKPLSFLVRFDNTCLYRKFGAFWSNGHRYRRQRRGFSVPP